MALTLNDVVLGARGQHPAFHRSRVPDATLARYLTGYQRELVGKALQIDPSFLAQQFSVGFNIAAANAIGTVGAGTGGRPIDADVGVLSTVDEPAGTAVQVDVDGSDVVALVSESVVASATTTTLTKTAAGWTTNAYANYTVVITAGRGAGQRRTIASNTATVLTVSDAWTTTPDSTSMFRVVDEVLESDKTFGAVAAEPFSATRVGYLVKVNASGTAYVDYTTPLVARYDVGIPLPTHHALIGGTVRFADEDSVDVLTLVDYQSRYEGRKPYTAFVQGQELFLTGVASDWEGVTSLDIRYVPVPPSLTALTDTMLLPESAYTALVNGAAYHAALRANGVEDAKVPVSSFGDAMAMSEQAWLRTVSAGKRNRFTVMKDWDGY